MTDKHELGDAPIDPKFRALMNDVARTLDRAFNGKLTREARKVGFVLLAFNFGDTPGRCNYISNANRADVVTMLKEQIKKFEEQKEG